MADATTSALKTYNADLLADQASVDKLEADAKASGLSAKGYGAESDAYTTAAEISTQNSELAGMSGRIKEYQQNRDLLTTVGSQRAAVGAAGFASSGSNVALLRSSYQQGYLDQQLTRTQTLLKQGAYLEEAAASRSEATAADYAEQAAIDSETSKTASAKTAKTTSTLEAQQLTGYLADNPDLANTPEGKISKALTSSDPDKALSDLTATSGWYKDSTTGAATGAGAKVTYASRTTAAGTTFKHYTPTIKHYGSTSI